MGNRYAEAELPVAAGTATAHDAALGAFAQPGAWWSGVDRVAIVEATRSAPVREAPAPAAEDDPGVLPPAAIEAIDGIRNRSGQIERIGSRT